MWNNFDFNRNSQKKNDNLTKKKPKKQSSKIGKGKPSKLPKLTEKDESANNITALSCFGNLTDPRWDIEDPNPDIYVLFQQFDKRFFSGRLSSIEVRWSPRMTLCAGLCCYEGRGGLCSVRLSQPLLKFRPRSDLINTLIHEMIHAYLFVTRNNRDRDGHGPEFQKHMNQINTEAGTNITIYHSFHNEVRLYQQHWWRCSGSCKNRAPFFGWVKRSMNRAPGPYDRWWSDHQQSCNGSFIKVREPEKKVPLSIQKSTTKRKSNDSAADIRKFFSPTHPNAGNLSCSTISSKRPKPTSPKLNIDLDASLTDEDSPAGSLQPSGKSVDAVRPTSPVFPGRGHVLGTVVDNQPRHSRLLDLYQPSQAPGPSSSSSLHSTNRRFPSHKSSSIRTPSHSKSPTPSVRQKLLADLWSPVTTPRANSVKGGDVTTDLLANLPEWRGKLPPTDIVSSPHFTPSPSSQVDQSNSRVTCPVCSFLTTMSEINDHLNLCLT